MDFGNLANLAEGVMKNKSEDSEKSSGGTGLSSLTNLASEVTGKGGSSSSDGIMDKAMGMISGDSGKDAKGGLLDSISGISKEAQQAKMAMDAMALIEGKDGNTIGHAKDLVQDYMKLKK
ncbi:hypothetical protein AYI68_g1494 [Smittium mucronatum]|uniref:Uncharacterized protein n=1 Tax=Smittium mucronatum TaxID=133383 RepID=A0A1R0H5H1_9FUNG|nr:hypothetical protein AYI68_g1494 [Smittium mucronatum]